ncbi:hypothetical protein BB561_005486 [Smittium simulii]|uniref:Palmitoyltransferase n=1 Tax=Smittium simulii TaxID=133385 RepID=A0A2T9YA46_9FUNG|nr:hypothetical protein BB561_005486 [Smittium simulii]
MLALIGVPLNIFFYLKTLTTDPGFITKENHKQALEMFEFDNVLYFPKYCKVCDFECPARSYHCKMCNKCVLGYDHHCVLTHRCVGIRNERYLYSFSISFILICVIGYVFNFVTMMSFATKSGYPPNYYYNFETKQFDLSKGFYGIFHDHPSEWVLNFILLFGVPVGAIFTLFQTYLHFSGITTYEHYRRIKLRNDIKDKKVFFIIPPKDSGRKKYIATIDPDNNSSQVPIEDDCERVLVNYVDQIPYAYSQGFVQNMLNVLFPKF